MSIRGSGRTLSSALAVSREPSPFELPSPTLIAPYLSQSSQHHYSNCLHHGRLLTLLRLTIGRSTAGFAHHVANATKSRKATGDFDNVAMGDRKIEGLLDDFPRIYGPLPPLQRLAMLLL